MPQVYADNTTGWAPAVRQRREGLLIRLAVGAATALVVSPLLGWAFSTPWLAAYFLMQLVELAVFSPINSGKTERMGLFRNVVGAVILFANTAMIGGLAVPLWMQGGAMGGICASILLPAVVLYSTVNAPRSPAVLAITTAPQFLYMAATPLLMTLNGASPAYATAGGCAAVVFALFCLATWQRMNRDAQTEAQALALAEARARQAERVMASRSAFLAAVGHDLRTPIGAILTGAAEVSRSGDPSTRSNAALITDAGLMMKALLDDLLDHSKLEAGRMTVDAADFDLRALIAQTLRLWHGPARAKGLKLTVTGARTLPAAVRGDAMRIRQVLNNLISNAMKFTDTGSITLALSAWAEDGGDHAVLIEVADTGPGMTRDQLDRLFTAFDQTADGVGARHGGSGLGLSISRELVQLMGGRLTARSAPGQGARFTLSLSLPRGEALAPLTPVTALDDASRGAIARALSERPRAASPTPTPTPAPVPAPTPAPAVTQPAAEPAAAPVLEAEPEIEEDEGRPLAVLVVDDHDINRRAIQLILQPLGCDITTAADGMLALAACEAAAFDVIFMDVRMPELDGRETTRRLRKGGGLNAATPVVAVTADTAPEDVEACKAAGMAYFVSKPLTPPALLGALQHVLADAQAASEEAEPEIVAA